MAPITIDLMEHDPVNTNLLTRRTLMERLALLAAASRAASAAGFQGLTIDHVSLLVSDLGRSSEFYRRVFGCTVLNEAGGVMRLSLAQGQITLRRGNPSAQVDHFAIGIDGFDKDAVIRELKSRGTSPTEDPAAGLNVKDPDGFPVQITSNLTYAGKPAAFPGATVNHVSIMVSDLKRSVDYYVRVFGGSVGTMQDNLVQVDIGKHHLSLRAGQPSGRIDHFAIGIDHFDRDSVIRDLKARGATAENLANVGLHVKDPDGYPVQVIANAV